MSILKIARLGHPVLYSKAKPVNNIADSGIKKIIHDMTETMLDAEGIGLAAPQVHIKKQIIIFRVFDDDNSQDNEIKVIALINPKIYKVDDEQDSRWEGCLSIPGMLGLVKRFSKINYEGYDMQGNLIKQTAQGMQARVIQHEYDHLQGILYTHKLVDKNAYGFEGEIEKYWKVNNDKN